MFNRRNAFLQTIMQFLTINDLIRHLMLFPIKKNYFIKYVSVIFKFLNSLVLQMQPGKRSIISGIWRYLRWNFIQHGLLEIRPVSCTWPGTARSPSGLFTFVHGLSRRYKLSLFNLRMHKTGNSNTILTRL